MYSITPLIHFQPLSSELGLNIYLKLENLQKAGSFKIRGIGHICNEFYKNGVRHFVSSSGGNAGYAVAYAGKELGAKVNVFVPESSSQTTIEKITSLNAEVIQIGADWNETNKHALNFAKEKHAEYISPFDHPLIWQGHSSIVDELAYQVEKPDLIILSVGGGGLLCGVLEGLHRNSWQDVPVLAVETFGTRSLAASIEAQSLVSLDSISGIATSLGSKTIAQEAFNWLSKHEIKSLLVTDEEALSACISFKKIHGYLVEPACGTALAALSHKEILGNAKSIVVIVCGGINTTLVESALASNF